MNGEVSRNEMAEQYINMIEENEANFIECPYCISSHGAHGASERENQIKSSF